MSMWTNLPLMQHSRWDPKVVQVVTVSRNLSARSIREQYADGILEITLLRHGMWTAVSQRKHTINKVFPFGSDSLEVMLYGDVEYELKAGGRATVEWGGRAELEKSADDGKYRMKFYQVYLVSL